MKARGADSKSNLEWDKVHRVINSQEKQKRQEGLTIYPDKILKDKLVKEADRQKRSLNNLILFLLDSVLGAKT